MPANTITTSIRPVIWSTFDNVEMLPVSLEVTERRFKHNIAVVTLRAIEPSNSLLRTGVPVQVDFGWTPTDYRSFYGYVAYAEPMHFTAQAENVRDTKVYCIGASYPFNSAGTAVFTDMTASQIARDVATIGSFSSVIEDHSWIWDQQSVGGASHWKFMVDLAQQIGFDFFINGTDLHFHSATKLINAGKSNAPMFIGPDLSSTPTLLHFNPLSGEIVPDTFYGKRLAWNVDIDNEELLFHQADFVDPSRIGVFRNDPVFDIIESHTTVNQPPALPIRANGSQERERWYIRATARTVGDVAVYQGTPISLQGIHPRYAGFWCVLGVNHQLTNADYKMELDLGRDGEGDTGDPRIARTQALGFSAVADRSVTGISEQFQAPGSRRAGNTWIADGPFQRVIL